MTQERKDKLMRLTYEGKISEGQILEVFEALTEAEEKAKAFDWLVNNRYALIPGMPQDKHDYWVVRYFDGRPSLDGHKEALAAIQDAMSKEGGK